MFSNKGLGKDYVMDIQETEFEDPAPSKQKRIIHFSSGETLELDDSEEEDEERQSSSKPPFTEPSDKVRRQTETIFILGSSEWQGSHACLFCLSFLRPGFHSRLWPF